MAGFIKKEFPGLQIVLGGGLVTSWLRRPGWKTPFAGLIDHLIAGPGEYPLISVLGIGPDKSHSTPDFDDLPVRDYIAPGIILPYSASSGCYWHNCSFCPEKAEGNHMLLYLWRGPGTISIPWQEGWTLCFCIFWITR